MAQRAFAGVTPSFYNQPNPLYDDDDFANLGGTAVRPWQNRIAHLSINTGGYPVWSGQYPTVACRNLIINAMLGAHLNAFSTGVITTYRNVTWRDRLLSSLSLPPIPRPPPAPQPPPAWVPAESVPLSSANYQMYALNFDRMWPLNLDIHVMSLMSLTDRGPVILLERPATHIPTMVLTAMLSYVGTSVVHIALQAYIYAGQLPQPGNSIQAMAFQWLACILFGSLTGRLHRSRSCEGFYFGFSKATDNQDDITLRWNDGVRTALPANRITRYVACGSPHWQQSMLHTCFALLAQASSSLRPLPALIDSANLALHAAAVPGLTGIGPAARALDRYNYTQLNVAMHAEWAASGIVTAAQQAVYDAATNAQAAGFMAHLTAMELAHPLNRGRIVVQPFAAGDVNAAFETANVVAAANAMFP
ncbi:VP6 [Fall chinook aquareovirus]|uniref:VP6 n=1 Tax=Fall chinook aquareovirus TaxID=1963254 RepID=UPI0009958F53|nr:VP6 [Fall chinook aquareovirus]AQU42733.1 VP6 [Fall chinook aquareovirus]